MRMYLHIYICIHTRICIWCVCVCLNAHAVRLHQVKLELVPRVEALESDAQESGAHCFEGCFVSCQGSGFRVQSVIAGA